MGAAMFVCWSMVVARLPLSFAYPFTSITYLVVMLMSMALLHERPNSTIIIGTLVVTAGVVIIGLGAIGGTQDTDKT